MARWAFRGGRVWRSLAGSALLSAVTLTGCGKMSPSADSAHDAVTETPAKEPTAPTAAVVQSTSAKPAQPAFGDDDPLHQPMAKAAHLFSDPPEGASVPVDVTLTGKSTVTLFDKVKDLWETIRFKTLDGKTIDYSASVETDLGTMTIALRPDVAPNHVRSFVALALAGYYDGLAFDRIQFQEAPGENGMPPIRLESIEAGNPRGPEELNGSIGYWMLPEFSDKLPHEEGTIGACLEGALDAEGHVAPDSAGCRFYITLTKDPLLDGNYTAFGKIMTGLDVARRIYAVPVMAEDRDRDGVRRPAKLVFIKRVTIQTHVAEATK
jgi:peptidyl-prolyl cis-trans isomerase B (cyclophilin B)